MTDSESTIDLRVAACSYEGSLFGWNVANSTKTSPMSFGFNLGTGCLKAIAISKSGRLLVVGGADERIRIFDTADNKAVGELSNHTGAITHLEFYEDSYLISGSEDCSLCLWRVSDWECVHVLGGHKEAVHSCAIHPTGKLALSVSKDNTMKLWNLVQGRCAFTRRLKKPADVVLWHDSGLYYLIVSSNDIQLYLAADNSCRSSITLPSRVNKGVFTCIGAAAEEGAADQFSNWRIAAVCEDKKLRLFDFDGQETADIDLAPLNGGRVKDLWSNAVAHKSLNHGLVLVTSLGLVAVLNPLEVETSSKKSISDVEKSVLWSYKIQVEPRLTSVVAWIPYAKAAKKQKQLTVTDDAEVAPAVAEQQQESTGKKSKKRPAAVVEEQQEVTQGQEQEQQSVSKKDNKKKAKKAAAAVVEDQEEQQIQLEEQEDVVKSSGSSAASDKKKKVKKSNKKNKHESS